MKVLIIILMILILLFSTLSMPFTRKSNDKMERNYEYILSESIDNRNARVIDIAMLGAHDAFTCDLNYSSEPNINEDGIFNKDVVNALAKGFSIRMSKAQVSSAKELLYSGVRYFDVRVTKIDDEYYTMHGYLSNKLSVYVQEIVDFLGTHNGEFIIFDIQHFFTENGSNYDLSKEEYEDLVLYLMNIKNDSGKSLIDYTNYDSSGDISELRYSNITRDKKTAGAIILAKTSDFPCIYDRDKNIRSNWHNTNSNEKMIDGINSEYEYLCENEKYSNILRVNQAQKTGFISDITLIKSMCNWSLINMANNFNKTLVNNEDFSKWLNNLPIVMVDYSDSTKGDFNKKANEMIIEFNKNL